MESKILSYDCEWFGELINGDVTSSLIYLKNVYLIKCSHLYY